MALTATICKPCHSAMHGSDARLHAMRVETPATCQPVPAGSCICICTCSCSSCCCCCAHLWIQLTHCLPVPSGPPALTATKRGRHKQQHCSGPSASCCGDVILCCTCDSLSAQSLNAPRCQTHLHKNTMLHMHNPVILGFNLASSTAVHSVHAAYAVPPFGAQR